MSATGFLRAHWRLLGFGFLAALGSSFGQTFFISLFNSELRAAFGLSQTGFGAVYSAGTLTSAVLMIQIGALIDRVDLARYTAFVGLGLGAVCLYISVIPVSSVLFLYLAIFGLRFLGQGLMSHVSVTTMARSFDRARGRAVSVAGLGHAAGEAIFPVTGVALLAFLGWRFSWAAFGVFVLAVLLPILLWMIKGRSHATTAGTQSNHDGASSLSASGPSRRDVLRDPRFYLLLPAVLAPGFINTGIFFAQVPLAQEKGWPLTLFAAGFAVYAGVTVIGALIGGAAVDRFSALRLYPFVLLPLAIAMAWLGSSAHPFTVVGFMALAGCAQGGLSAVSGSLWAEIYGTAHLGAIRSMAVSLMVFSTALSPILMGTAIDHGLSLNVLAYAFALYAFFAAMLITLTWRLTPATSGQKSH